MHRSTEGADPGVPSDSRKSAAAGETEVQRSREWREHRIRKSLQQSCHLDHAATDLHSLSRPSARAYSPVTAPNRVPSARSQQPKSAPRHPPNGRQRPLRRWPVPSLARFGLAPVNCM